MHYFPFLWSLCDNSAGRLCMVTNMLGFVNWLFLFLVKIQQNKELFNVKLIFPSSKLKQSCLTLNRNIAAIHSLSNCLRTWLPNSVVPISVSTYCLTYMVIQRTVLDGVLFWIRGHWFCTHAVFLPFLTPPPRYKALWPTPIPLAASVLNQCPLKILWLILDKIITISKIYF